MKALLLVFILLFATALVPREDPEREEEREVAFDLMKERMIEITVQQKQILVNQDKIDGKLEGLRAYQEQIRLNTDRISRLEAQVNAVDTRTWGVTVMVLVAIIAAGAQFLLGRRT